MIDKARCIEHVGSIVSQIIHALPSRCRLLITSIPLQDNFKELLALLSETFVDYADLDDFLRKDAKGEESEEDKSRKVLKALHMILRPFLLRRVKADVEKSLLPPKRVV